MADPTFRAVSAIGTIAGAGGGGAGSVNKPTGTVDGDYIFIVILNKANAFAANAAPSGFSLLLSKTNTTYQAGFRIYGKVASSEPSSYSFTETSTANASQVFAISYSNPGGTPINASVVGSLENSVTTIAVPGLTTTATGKLIGLLAEYQGRSIAITAAGSMTSRLAAANTDVSFMWADEDVATTGSITGRTGTGAPSGDYTSAAILLASAVATPTITGPSATPTGRNAVTGSVTTNGADGNLYVVATSTSTPATGAQIEAGLDSAGAAANASGSQAISSSGVKNVALTGITPDTVRYLQFVHKSSSGLYSNVVVSAQFTCSTLAYDGSTIANQVGIQGNAFVWSGANPSTKFSGGVGAKTLSGTGFSGSGLTVNGSTGVPAGTCGTPGVYTCTIVSTDSSSAGSPAPQTANSNTFTLTILAPATIQVTAQMAQFASNINFGVAGLLVGAQIPEFTSSIFLGQRPGVITFPTLANGPNFNWVRSDVIAVIKDTTLPDIAAPVAVITGITAGSSGGSISDVRLLAGRVYEVTFKIPAGGLLPNGAQGIAYLTAA